MDTTPAALAAQEPTEIRNDPDAPLGPIGLSLSGGGYRAAGFHLGVLGLLSEVGLLRDVAALSTVSGGTIVGIRWVVSLLDGVSFDEFRERFRAWLTATNVVREALGRLTSHPRGDVRSNPSLIRCAAAVYAAPDFLGDRRLGEVLDGEGIPAEIIFNSTEFRSGNDFRFRRSPNSRAKIGNGNFPVPREVAAQVRLADVVAASSCFPGGFEPILFPDEFHWAPGVLERVRQELGTKFEPALPLMDGGIYDNQGVESVLRANEHGEADTLLISDTNTRQAALYVTPPAPHRGWFTLRMAAWAGRLLFVLAAASVVALGVHAWREQSGNGWQWQDILVYVVPGILCIATIAALIEARRTALEVRTRLRTQVQIAHAWKDLRDLTLTEAMVLVELRALSLISLTSNVFMKRVRGLVQASVFGNARYEKKRAMVLLYGLDEPHPKLYGEVPWLRPSQHLVDAVHRVDRMSTTLWFDSPEQLPTLERVGAATATFSLLRLIVERHGPDGGPAGSPVRELFDRLRGKWDGFNASA
ncbi:MAG TPA: patatin-like phospholipase family protein [Longimicrobium sp.]|jgi:predicted acylesterase/phospholipase RssA